MFIKYRIKQEIQNKAKKNLFFLRNLCIKLQTNFKNKLAYCVDLINNLEEDSGFSSKLNGRSSQKIKRKNTEFGNSY